MKRYILSSVLASLLFLGACNLDTNKIDLSKLDTDKIIQCNPPYIRVGAECCVDSDDNKICDKDDIELSNIKNKNIDPGDNSNKNSNYSVPICENVCRESYCKGLEYIECLKDSDSCFNELNKGKIVDKCGVECTTNGNCGMNKECVSFKCKQKEEICSDECSGSQCNGLEFIECKVGNDGCKNKISDGKVKDKCGVECLNNQDCSASQECRQFKCATSNLVDTLKSNFELVDLSEYPSFLISNNLFKGTLVISDNAVAEDVISSADIGMSLQYSAQQVQNGVDEVVIQRVEVGATKLSSETVANQNVILIGSPCEKFNVFSNILGGSFDKNLCIEGYKYKLLAENKGLIAIIKQGNFYYILVWGYAPFDTRNAANVLANYGDYRLSGTICIVTRYADASLNVACQ